MKEIVEKIQTLCGTVIEESNKNLNGNKAAGARARKASIELEKALKEYRKISVSFKAD